MKVRMIVSISGTRGGVDWPRAGEIIEVSDEEGAQLCAGQLAQPVVDQAAGVETATQPPAEERAAVTTDNGPVRRGPGRPRKTEE